MQLSYLQWNRNSSSTDFGSTGKTSMAMVVAGSQGHLRERQFEPLFLLTHLENGAGFHLHELFASHHIFVVSSWGREASQRHFVE